MKTFYRIAVGLFAVAVLAAGCQDELTNMVGRPVKFGVSTVYENGPFTKTAYSGQLFGGTTKYERIDWVTDDLIRIVSDGAATPSGENNADYKVTGATPDEEESHASITNASSNGLIYSAGTQTFYALYPSPETSGATASISGASFSGTIPTAQTVTLQSGTGIYQPDMKSAYMWAATKINGPTEQVNLEFRPAVTAFLFTIGYAGTEMTVNSAELSSTMSSLAGNFTGTIATNLASCNFSCPARTTANSKITISFAGGPVTITGDQTITFAVLALPQDLTGLTLTLNTDKGARKLALKYSDDSFISFPATKKSRVSNVEVPLGYYVIEPIGPVTTAYNGGSATVRVISYYQEGTTRTAKPWHFEYSMNDGATWTRMSATQKPAMIASCSSYSGAGATSTGNSVTINVAGATATKIDKDASSNFNTTPRSNNKNAPFDLSTHDIYGNTWSGNAIETANCYVVNAPGWYMFPLVYGNAINTRKVNNTTTGNTNAYAPTATTQKTSYLTPFLKHDNAGITSPYIAIPSGVTPVAKVSWQDALSEVIQDNGEYLDIVDGASVGGRLNCMYVRFYIDPAKDSGGNLLHMQRGNAVIKVMVGSTVYWSWHIWMTDQNLATVNVKYFLKNGSTSSLDHFPVNLGWVNGTKLVTDYWQKHSCRIRAVCNENNAVVSEFTVTQNERIGTNWTSQVVNIGPLWQWGRKDPMLPIFSGDGVDVGTDKSYTGSDTWDISHTRSSATTIGWSIQHPFSFIKGKTGTGTDSSGQQLADNTSHGDWVYDGRYSNGVAHYRNLWDATQTVHSGNSDTNRPTATNGNNNADKNTVKTVYDPCPPGFCVPRRNAYSGFLRAATQTTGNPETSGQTWVKGSWNRGLTFYTQMQASGATIFFPADGARSWYTGELMFNSSLYWTAALLDNSRAAYMNLNRIYVGPYYGIYNVAYRSRAHSIRPVKETW